MKLKTSFLCAFILNVVFLSGCFTQLDLVNRKEQPEYYNTESEEVLEDTGTVGKYYVESDCCYDAYYDYYGYQDPWWYYPRWGLFVGYYPSYLWRYSFYDPFGRWWYYDNYYSYWYYPAYGYSHNSFQKRTFDRRSPHKRSAPHNRLVSRGPSDKLLTDHSARSVRSRSVSRTNRHSGTRPSIRNERTGYGGRTVLRRGGKSEYRGNSHSRRPSFSTGRSSNIRSSGRSSSSRSSRSSGSRSNNTSSRRSSRR